MGQYFHSAHHHTEA
uniref:Uncharacterized protein n=1 Tax=Arundo donax TaxID=35708 RepID=A0A0A8ZG40_ARUDO